MRGQEIRGLPSQICILQAKIHKVINDICNINKGARTRQTNIHKYKSYPSSAHNSLPPDEERICLSGENHPDPNLPDPLEDAPPSIATLSTSNWLTTWKEDMTDPSSSPSSRIVDQCDHPPSEGELETREGTLLEEEEPPD